MIILVQVFSLTDHVAQMRVSSTRRRAFRPCKGFWDPSVVSCIHHRPAPLSIAGEMKFPRVVLGAIHASWGPEMCINTKLSLSLKFVKMIYNSSTPGAPGWLSWDSKCLTELWGEKTTYPLRLLPKGVDDKLKEGVIFLLLLRQFRLSLAGLLSVLGDLGVGELLFLLSFTFPIWKFLLKKKFIPQPWSAVCFGLARQLRLFGDSEHNLTFT